MVIPEYFDQRIALHVRSDDRDRCAEFVDPRRGYTGREVETNEQIRRKAAHSRPGMWIGWIEAGRPTEAAEHAPWAGTFRELPEGGRLWIQQPNSWCVEAAYVDSCGLEVQDEPVAGDKHPVGSGGHADEVKFSNSAIREALRIGIGGAVGRDGLAADRKPPRERRVKHRAGSAALLHPPCYVAV